MKTTVKATRRCSQMAINNALIVGLLGFAAAMIALVILANTVSSAIDQERKRFGILQSIGVEEKTFKKQQYMTGLKHGLLSLAIANAVMLIVLFRLLVDKQRLA